MKLKNTETTMATDPDWSDPSKMDVVQPVLERLRFPDFCRSRSVCSLWNNAAKHGLPKPNQVPWLLVFPIGSFHPVQIRPNCRMFNPEEDRIYETTGFGYYFCHCCTRCIATCGNWLLLIDARSNLFLCNVFTRERIDLPPLTSLHGPNMRILRRSNRYYFRGMVGSTSFSLNAFTTVFGVLRVDDKSRDYSVVLKFLNILDEIPIAMFCKRGDATWRHVPTLDRCNDMAYMNGKLYVHDHDFRIRIFDLSEGLPRDVTTVNRYVYPSDIDASDGYYCYRQYISMAVTNSGSVLFVVRRVEKSKDPVFRIYKINPEGTEAPEKVDSIGGEALMFDMGITVPARNIPGVEENSIYFSYGRAFPLNNERDICVVNVTTGNVKRFEKCDAMCKREPRDARWFVPTFPSV